MYFFTEKKPEMKLQNRSFKLHCEYNLIKYTRINKETLNGCDKARRAKMRHYHFSLSIKVNQPGKINSNFWESF